MLETSARLLRLLTLLQARSYWSGTDLAERLGVTERTVRRDIDKVRLLGYPVRSSAGVAGGYQLGAGAALPPLLLEDDEALAVSVGLGMAAAGTVTGMAQAAVRALAKLEQLLPVRLRRETRALQATVAPLCTTGPRFSLDVLTTLAQACRNHERLVFRYEDGQGKKSERRVEPHGLVNTGLRWYLAAWDLGRTDWRTFRLDRVLPRTVRTEERFVPRTLPGGDLAGYVARSVASQSYPFRARVRLHAPLERMRARIPALVGNLEGDGPQHCVLEAGAHSPGALAVHIALLDVDFEVLCPPELAEQMRVLAQRFARAAGPQEATDEPSNRTQEARRPELPANEDRDRATR